MGNYQNPYGPPQPPSGYGPPPGYGYAQPQAANVLIVAQKSGGTAVALELLPGFFFQWFGWGNIYAGNVGIGLTMMFGYWALTAINFGLCFIAIGFITWPLTWLAFAILSSVLASSACRTANAVTAAQWARVTGRS